MSKITYEDKAALNQNSNIPDINKVNDTDMNMIKNVVNNNETKYLLAVVNTAPATCDTGDIYFNTTDNLIYTATATNTWGSTGVAPTKNTIYVLLSTNSIYAYNGATLVSIGGKQPENAYSTSQDNSYSCDYVNGIIESGSNANGNYVKYADGTMICYREITKALNITRQWGSLYFERDNTQYAFAQEFIEVPKVLLTLRPTTTGAAFLGYYDQPVITTTYYQGYAALRPTSREDTPIALLIYAIGKWK